MPDPSHVSLMANPVQFHLNKYAVHENMGFFFSVRLFLNISVPSGNGQK